MFPSDVGPQRRSTVAAFDVDGTVTTRDCVVPFLRRIGGTAPLVARLARAAGQVAPALLRRDRDVLKAHAARAAFAGRPFGEVARAAEGFAGDVERAWIRSDTRDRLRWHQCHGHDVVFVSASFGVYLRPLAARLGVAGIVGTELVVDASGHCTGDLAGGNCRGPEKVRRLHAWLDEHHGGRAAVDLWAYGDSAGDEAMLADADHAVWAKGTTLTADPGPR